MLSFFSSRRNWDSPSAALHPQASVPHPPLAPGGGHTRWGERGSEGPNSNEGTYNVVLCIYMYFVVLMRKKSATYSTDYVVVQIRHYTASSFPPAAAAYPHAEREYFHETLEAEEAGQRGVHVMQDRFVRFGLFVVLKREQL